MSKKKIEVGDVFVIHRTIDKRLNYNICLFTGEYNFDKLVYQEYDPHLINPDKKAEEGNENLEYLYENIRKYLNKRFGYEREQIAVVEIINNNNDKKLIDYLEESKSKEKPYCEYYGKIEPKTFEWSTLNDAFLGESNDAAVLMLVKALNDLFGEKQ